MKDRERSCISACVITPVFNEEEVVEAFFARLLSATQQLPHMQFNYLFINDGSTDGTRAILHRLAAQRDDVSVIHFTRNFGHQKAVTAGLDHCNADIVCIIDADLQDPPECIPDMVKALDQGYDIVYAQRTERKSESIAKQATAKLFYRLLKRLSAVDIPLDTGDFRVMRRQVVETIRSMKESHRFIRGMAAWTGHKSKAFPYVREPRFAGSTKYSIMKMMRFAKDAIVSFSTFPLQLSSVLGLAVTSAGLLGILYCLGRYLFSTGYIPGIDAVLSVVLFLGGLQLLSLGIMGEYIGRAFEQSQGRPLYVIKETEKLHTNETAASGLPGHQGIGQVSDRE